MIEKRKGGNAKALTPQISHDSKSKYTNFSTQYQIVRHCFSSQTPKTMLMVSIETGILRANICRYVSEMRKDGIIEPIGKGICRISKHGAIFYSTNDDVISNKKGVRK